jgi:hypothetical protein
MTKSCLLKLSMTVIVVVGCKTQRDRVQMFVMKVTTKYKCRLFGIKGQMGHVTYLHVKKKRHLRSKKRPLARHRKDIYQKIFISYPISKNLQKGYFLSFFGAGYFEDNIHILFLGLDMDRI